MKITPMDIQQQQFKGKMLGGLDPEDVDAFLQMVAGEMEELMRENNDLKERLNRNATAMAEMEAREVQLRETMLAAQRITEEMKANAQKEAHLMISEAELKGERIIADAENKLVQLNNQIQDLKRDKLQFESGFKNLLDTYYKLLALDK
ncbi:DivIVA domain-containing protein [Geomonas sp. Red69]|uniref:DivIVA domain-containing protein n=1 Tax=Geomonas diazotrophica TaxID=2843197 RepID=A0ABX8JHD0_9BACT|nr:MULTISPECIES: DivIVA domain-containing protein [Geomonas]MBU5636190.1 DivIVA domain-containing protein [Geomonas diazotrophica]QWV96087.1 DivIVA domain-containing protein [Geomonas nitrogeniifigens]QXE85155.1 DivIVA domain-containing protein [Geomonas nitrogeniifigens]